MKMKKKKKWCIQIYNRKHVFSLDACSICGFDARHPLPASPCRSNTLLHIFCECVHWGVFVCGACRNVTCSMFSVQCLSNSFVWTSFALASYALLSCRMPMFCNAISRVHSLETNEPYDCVSVDSDTMPLLVGLHFWLIGAYTEHTHASTRNNHACLRVSHCLTFLLLLIRTYSFGNRTCAVQLHHVWIHLAFLEVAILDVSIWNFFEGQSRATLDFQ